VVRNTGVAVAATPVIIVLVKPSVVLAFGEENEVDGEIFVGISPIGRDTEIPVRIKTEVTDVYEGGGIIAVAADVEASAEKEEDGQHRKMCTEENERARGDG
jgi:hypothetical protein